MPSRNGSMYVARVADLGQNELDCHSYGHAWSTNGTPVQVYDARSDMVVTEEQLECLRCPKVRTDALHPVTGKKLGRSRYTEVERFRVLENIPRGRAAYRAESLRRQLRKQRQVRR